MIRTDNIPNRIQINVLQIKGLKQECIELGSTIPYGWISISNPPNKTTDEIELYFFDKTIFDDYIRDGGYDKKNKEFIKYECDTGEGVLCDWAIAWRYKK